MYNGEYFMVYSLDCGGLYVGFSAVSAFIGSFNVNVNEVVVLQRINSRLCLAAVVCVKVARPIPLIRSTAEMMAHFSPHFSLK